MIFSDHYVTRWCDREVINPFQDRIVTACNVVNYFQLLTVGVVLPDAVIVLRGKIYFVIMDRYSFTASKFLIAGYLASGCNVLSQGVGDNLPLNQFLSVFFDYRGDLQLAFA